MARLTKEAWANPTLATDEVEVPELGGSVLIRELPGEFSVSQFIEVENPGTRHARSRVNTEAIERKQFALSVVGEDGNPVFTEDEAGEIARKHGRAWRRVIDAIDKLSAIDKEGVEQTKARFPGSGAGEARKNGAPPPDGDGGPAVRVRAGAGDGEERA